MNRFFYVVAFLLFCLSTAHADRQQIEDAIRSDLQNRIVVLRGFYEGTNLRFDGSGKALGKLNAGYWASDGLIYISNITLTSDGRLTLGGKRAIYAYNPSQCRWLNLTTTPIEIEIRLGPDSQDLALARAVVDMIILRDLPRLKELAPEYWHPFDFRYFQELQQSGSLCGKPEPPPPSSSQEVSSNHENPAHNFQEEDDGTPYFLLPDGTKVFSSGPGLQPAKLLKSVDPSYTDAAKQAGYQGTSVLYVVLDARGEIKTIGIARVLGAGLDDEAVKAVKKWKFSPARYKGKPVAVQMNIEINFHL